MLRIFLAACIVLLPTLLFCQVPSCQVPTVVLDSNYEPIPHLSLGDVTVKLDHQPVQVTDVEIRSPQNVVLILDNSMEMSRLRSGWQKQILLLYWLASSAPNDVSLVVSSGKIEAVIQGREKVLAELKSRGEQNASFSGDSALASTILKTVEAMEAHPGDVVFAVGPPHYRASGETKKKLREALWKRGVRLFYLETNFRASLWSLPAGIDLQSESVDSGGGSALMGPSPEQVRQALVNEMYRFHSVEFELPENAAPGGEVQVRYSGPLKSVTTGSPKRALCNPSGK